MLINTSNRYFFTPNEFTGDSVVRGIDIKECLKLPRPLRLRYCYPSESVVLPEALGIICLQTDTALFNILNKGYVCL